MKMLEEVLGSTDGRYFGAGYRNVDYRLQIGANSREMPLEIASSGSAAYPASWSVGMDNEPRAPHLSSIDAIVLPLMALETATLPEHRGQLSKCRVQSIDLRAGNVPWLELDVIPVKVRRNNVGPRIELASTVGNIRANISLVQDNETFPRSDQDLPCDAVTVYGGLFKAINCRSLISFLTTDSGARILHGSHELCSHGIQTAPLMGVESAFWPSPTAIDYLVTMGQLTQALLYDTGDTDRAQVGTLWMRSMKITIDRPSAPSNTFETTTRILRNRLLQRSGRRIHDILVESSTTSGVVARSSLSYTENTAE